MSKVFIWIGGIFAPIGLLFVSLAAGFLINDRSFAEAAVGTQGTVIAVSGGRAPDGGYASGPMVEYFTPDGDRHVYASSVSSNPPSFSRGERVPVLYDPTEPTSAVIDTFLHRYFMPSVFGGIGSVFALVGLGMLWAYWRRKRVIGRLLRRGVSSRASFVECYRDTSTKINGRSPYIVVAQGTNPISGELQSYKSEAIWLDLSEELSGKQVPVIVDPHKPSKHFVDLRQWVSPDMRA